MEISECTDRISGDLSGDGAVFLTIGEGIPRHAAAGLLDGGFGEPTAWPIGGGCLRPDGEVKVRRQAKILTSCASWARRGGIVFCRRGLRASLARLTFCNRPHGPGNCADRYR